MQRGDNLTISVELDDVRNGKQLWGEQYNRKLTDLLAVKSDIARELSQRINKFKENVKKCNENVRKMLERA